MLRTDGVVRARELHVRGPQHAGGDSKRLPELDGRDLQALRIAVKPGVKCLTTNRLKADRDAAHDDWLHLRRL